jgi:hypothetical protein
MKKIILLVAIAIFTFSNTFAQEEKSEGLKGAWYGLGALSYVNDEAADTSAFLILPAVGTFISADVTIGGAIGYLSTKAGDADANNTFIVMPFIRKYYGVTDKFFLFGEANVPLYFNENANSYGFFIQPGIDYFIGGKWTLEAKFGRFGYRVTKPDGGDSTGTTELGFNMFGGNTEGLGSMSIGIKYLF